MSGRWEVGQVVECYLGKQLIGSVKCLSKQRYEQVNYLPESICYIDTGYDKANTLKILKTMYKMELETKPIYGYVFGFVTQFNLPAAVLDQQLNLFA